MSVIILMSVKISAYWIAWKTKFSQILIFWLLCHNCAPVLLPRWCWAHLSRGCVSLGCVCAEMCSLCCAHWGSRRKHRCVRCVRCVRCEGWCRRQLDSSSILHCILASLACIHSLSCNFALSVYQFNSQIWLLFIHTGIPGRDSETHSSVCSAPPLLPHPHLARHQTHPHTHTRSIVSVAT